MDEEDLVKEKMRSKQQEDQLQRQIKQDDKRISNLSRAEKNRLWRLNKEKDDPDLNWRTIEENVREELKCPCCREEMCPPKSIYQCRDGHVVCQDCFLSKEVKVQPKLLALLSKLIKC